MKCDDNHSSIHFQSNNVHDLFNFFISWSNTQARCGAWKRPARPNLRLRTPSLTGWEGQFVFLHVAKHFQDAFLVFSIVKLMCLIFVLHHFADHIKPEKKMWGEADCTRAHQVALQFRQLHAPPRYLLKKRIKEHSSYLNSREKYWFGSFERLKTLKCSIYHDYFDCEASLLMQWSSLSSNWAHADLI